MYCAKCGKNVADSEKICPKCGSEEFSATRRGAKFGGMTLIWMVISYAVNLALGVAYLFMGMRGMSPNINIVFKAPFLEFVMNTIGEFNLVFFILGLLIVLNAVIYIILMLAKKQFLYGAAMVMAIAIASFQFFFYGGSVLSIIMIPVMIIFPSLTRKFIGDEWDYMG